jgi:hypothetical protein
MVFQIGIGGGDVDRALERHRTPQSPICSWLLQIMVGLPAEERGPAINKGLTQGAPRLLRPSTPLDEGARSAWIPLVSSGDEKKPGSSLGGVQANENPSDASCLIKSGPARSDFPPHLGLDA